MKKLNFGCGRRFASGWVNIDFHSEHPEVQRVNLLRGFPFPDAHFEVVYSSHVLEHFNPGSAEKILRECHRVLKAGGIIRTVVPNLEETCREYLRVLGGVAESEQARRQYDWIILELLDRLVRTEPSGRMENFVRDTMAAGDVEFVNYLRSRTDTPPPLGKSRKLRLARIRSKVLYLYIAGIKRLLPPSVREAIVDNTRIGEKHKWMYDRYSMRLLMERCGFLDVAFLTPNRSDIPEFNNDYLDIDPDGRTYKQASLYCEARRV